MIIVDVETGGLDPHKCALVSVALYCMKTREVRSWLIKPDKGLEWTPEAEAVHGFRMGYLLEHGLPEWKVMKDVCDYLAAKQDEIGGANPQFDLGFLRSAAWRCGLKLPIAHRAVDVQTVAWVADRLGCVELPRKVPGGPPSCSLDAILETLGRPRQGDKHDAVEDVSLTAFCFTRLLGLIAEGKVQA